MRKPRTDKKHGRRPDYRLSPALIALEGSAVIKDRRGRILRRLEVKREKPNDDDYGMVQIKDEPQPLSVYQRFVQWQREKRVMNEVYRIAGDVIRPVVPR